jgi:hypothetical protein
MCELYGIDITTTVGYEDYTSIVIWIQPEGNRNSTRSAALQRESFVKFLGDLPAEAIPIPVRSEHLE